MKKAIVFDLDGTLLDTLQDIGAAANDVLARMGCPAHPLPAYRQFVGEGALVLFERALPGDRRAPEIIARAVGLFQEVYGAAYTRSTVPYPGIVPLLTALFERGVRCAVLSNKPHPITTLCIRDLLPAFRFEVVFGQRPHVPRKPDPAGALEIASEMRLDPGQFLYVGDTAIDMRTARAAHMVAVGVGWGFRPFSELREAGAEHLVSSPEEILPLLAL